MVPNPSLTQWHFNNQNDWWVCFYKWVRTARLGPSDPQKQQITGSIWLVPRGVHLTCESYFNSFSTHQGSCPGSQSCVAELMAGRWGGATAASWRGSSSRWVLGIPGTSPDAPAARWARGGEGWREARLVLGGPWGTLHPRAERRSQVGELGCQRAGLLGKQVG